MVKVQIRIERSKKNCYVHTDGVKKERRKVCVPCISTSPQLRPLTESCFSSGVTPIDFWIKLVKLLTSYAEYTSFIIKEHAKEP